MRKGLTEIVFILDRSGSMSGLEADTIGGYNSMLTKQKKEDGEAIISTVLFDDKIEVLHDRKNLRMVNEITDKDYYVRGCTALLDAVGRAIRHIGRIHKENPEEAPEKTLFIITTDGMENASREYTYDKVKKMVEKKKNKHNWEFVFLGANIDAISVAGRFGVAANRAVRFENDSYGAELNYQVMSDMVSSARSAKSARAMSEAFETGQALESIREDYEEYEKYSKSKETEISLTDDEYKAVVKIYPTLSEREKRVARVVFGLEGEKKHSMAEACGILNTNRGRVLQIANKIRNKACH